MAYHNVLYGNAAFVGSLGGMLSGRMITSANPSDYNSLRAAAAAAAVAVDALIPFDEGAEESAAALLHDICQSVWSGRFPSQVEASNATVLAAAIVTLWNAGVTDLED